STDKTPKLGLNQWAAGDKVLRADFNADNGKLDAAIARTERKADLALAKLKPVEYNLYNLLQQRQNEGKYTGFKRALIFDSMGDLSQVKTLSPGAWTNEGALKFCGAAQTMPLEDNFGSATSFTTQTTSLARFVETTGHGTITGGAIYLEAGSGNGCDISVSCNSTSINTYVSLKRGGLQLYTFSFPKALKLTPGVELFINIIFDGNGGSAGGAVQNSAGTERFGIRLTGTSTVVADSTCTMVPQDIGADYSQARVWVRYLNATSAPVVHLKNAADITKTMVCLGTAAVKDYSGSVCIEAEYLLEDVPPAPNRMVTSVLDFTDMPGILSIVDYGLTFG
ncbi:MAG: hypothetical protein RSB55_08210, partial [Oscillospiraceae bacterium]